MTPKSYHSLTFLLLFVYTITLGQLNNDPIIPIRKVVEKINSDTNYVIKIVPNEYYIDKTGIATDNGQELKGYFKDGKLKK